MADKTEGFFQFNISVPPAAPHPSRRANSQFLKFPVFTLLISGNFLLQWTRGTMIHGRAADAEVCCCPQRHTGSTWWPAGNSRTGSVLRKDVLQKEYYRETQCLLHKIPGDGRSKDQHNASWEVQEQPIFPTWLPQTDKLIGWADFKDTVRGQ